MAQTTRTRANICLLGGFVDIAPHFGGEIPETPNFGGVNRRFQAKRAKILKVSDYRNYYIDFNQNLHNDRDHQVVVVDDPNSRPTNPRWRTAAIWKKPLNRHISATVWPIFWDLVKWLILSHYSGSTVKISNFWKYKMATAAILKNHKNRDISATVWPILMKFGKMT